MSTTLYNKIHLGRASLLGSRRLQTVLALGTLAGAGLVWIALRTLR